MQNDTLLLLIAQRRALGVNMSELAEMPAIGQDNRVIADYERGRRKPSQSYIESMQGLSNQYQLLLMLLNRDIDRFNLANPLPITDDSTEYFEKIKSVKRLILPYFIEFNDFQIATGNDCKTYWRLWQAVVGHLALIGKIARINDDATIPDSFSAVKSWLRKDYDIKDLAGDK